jgi:hypothetical protein
MYTTVVFVHGWSVSNTNTYGQLPKRLIAEAGRHGLAIRTREIFLGRYISFHDEVRVKDISRAFEAAVRDQLTDLIKAKERFVCITHSTGGPVIREWWHRYYQPAGSKTCPMSHLIMLAPANYGSALAVLGKAKLSRMKSWFQGVEPGQGVLDWLALGSAPAWELNQAWIESKGKHVGPKGVFPFVLTGQTIDRALYDNINSYTGELGSDGVVRVAAANLQANYVRLVQQKAVAVPGKRDKYRAPKLELEKKVAAAKTPLRIVEGKSHSGASKGIMRSVPPAAGTAKNQATVDAIFTCVKVKTKADYTQVAKDFDRESKEVQEKERLEVERRRFWVDTTFIHDQFSMVIFRVRDHEGFSVSDFDLVLTAGKDSDPNHLPKGFFADRQLNSTNRDTVTYYFNHSIMTGCDAVMDGDDEVRPKLPGTTALGFKITARPDDGFAHYLPCSISASAEFLRGVMNPNATTMVDIVLRRVVGEETFRLDKGTKMGSFKSTKPGKPLTD